jgi:hypothetical protein
VTKGIIAKAMTAEGISELVTVPNVPMISTGIDYPTSTGLLTFTEQHLQDLVTSQDDPAIHPPRTKIGHSDPRFNASETPDGVKFDGEPSLGTWQNLRLTDNGQTVVGDIVGVPKWLAAIMSTAYPNRSVEGNFDVETVTGKKWSLSIDAVALLGVVGPGVTTLDDLPQLFTEEGPDNVQVVEAAEGEPMSVIHASQIMAESVSEKPWSDFPNSAFDDAQYARAAIYDRNKCSADWSDKPAKQRYSLPVREPDGTINRAACHNAAGRINQVTGGCDAAAKAAATTLVNIYKNSLKEDPPDSLTKLAASEDHMLNSGDKPKVKKGTKASKITGQVNLDDVRRSYYDSLSSQQMWWWIRAIYFDPNELIVDDDEGGLYRVAFTTKGDSINFTDSVPVKIQYVDQPIKSAIGAAIRASVAASITDETPKVMYTVRAESRPGVLMTLNAGEAKSLREKLGLTAEQLPDDASDEAVSQVVVKALLASEGESGSGENKDGDKESHTTAITSTEEAGRIPTAAKVNLPDGTIVVDKATWDEVAGQARQGAELAARTRDSERDEFLNSAIKAGKFPPSRKEHYLSAWKADPEGTKGLIESLAPGLVPVEARGTAGTGKDETVDGGVSAQAYDPSWLTTSERHRIKAAGQIHNGDVPTPMVVQGGD